MNFSSNELGRDYSKFCKLRNEALETGLLDLGSVSWFYPTLTLPLAIFRQENPDIEVLRSLTFGGSSSYFSFITSGHDSLADTLLPIKEIPVDRKEDVIDRLCDIENGDCIGNSQAFIYLVSELVDNVYEHSEFSSGYIMAQKYPAKRFLDITIVDNGISIPQSLANVGHDFTDGDAIWNAVNGLSTKYTNGRGYGLKTSIRLLVQGLHGKCLIISRSGGFIADENNFIYKMGDFHLFSGTLISIRVPYRRDRVNIYDYISK